MERYFEPPRITNEDHDRLVNHIGQQPRGRLNPTLTAALEFHAQMEQRTEAIRAKWYPTRDKQGTSTSIEPTQFLAYLTHLVEERESVLQQLAATTEGKISLQTARSFSTKDDVRTVIYWLGISGLIPVPWALRTAELAESLSDHRRRLVKKKIKELVSESE